MFATARSLLEQSWPVLGSLYLLYLALQAPPIRYVGVVGLMVVTPLLVGWVVGATLGMGPWADAGDGDGDVNVGGDGDDPSEATDVEAVEE